MENIRKAIGYIKQLYRKIKKQITHIQLNRQQKTIATVAICIIVIGLTALLIWGAGKGNNGSGQKPVIDITGDKDANKGEIEIPLDEQEAAQVPEIDVDDPYGAIQGQNQGQGTSMHIKDVIFNDETKKVAHGIDVSKYQGTINWERVAESGIQFAMIRVGYRTMVSGEIKEDSYAKYNMQEAAKYGIKVGVYFFSAALTEQEAVEEADFTLNIIKGYKITFPVAYDCEGYQDSSNRHANISEARRTNNALAFMKRIADKGYTPMFYGSQSHLEEGEYWEVERISSLYKMWIAQYTATPYPATLRPKFDGECAMWQYTNKGVVSGIGAKVDLNVAYFGFEGTQKPEEIPEPTPDANPEQPPEISQPVAMLFDLIDEQVTAKYETNLWDKPSQGDDSQVLYTLLNGQVAKRTGINKDKGWSRIEYDGKVCYAESSLLTTDLTYKKPQEEQGGIQTQFQDVNEQVTQKEQNQTQE